MYLKGVSVLNSIIRRCKSKGIKFIAGVNHNKIIILGVNYLLYVYA